MTIMRQKPTYLGLLNAIAVGEARGYALLSAWKDATGDTNLAEVLNVVAIREQEHSAAFTKRLCELGFSVREKPSSQYEENLRLAASDASDVEKFQRILGYEPEGQESSDNADDPLAEVFSDRTIDPQTGGLLGRFVAEERDSERRLRGALATLCRDAPTDPVLQDIATRLDRLSATLEDLKKLRA
jgi:hypothetical protein